MTIPRRQPRGEFKAQVALEATRGERTREERAAASGAHPVHIAQWKNLVVEELPTMFSSRRGPKPNEEEAWKVS
jgi:hypothetical protein